MTSPFPVDHSKKKLEEAIKNYKSEKAVFDRLAVWNAGHIETWKKEEAEAKEKGGNKLLQLYAGLIKKSKCE